MLYSKSKPVSHKQYEIHIVSTIETNNQNIRTYIEFKATHHRVTPPYKTSKQVN